MNHPPNIVVRTAGGRLGVPVARRSWRLRAAKTTPRRPLELMLPANALDVPSSSGRTATPAHATRQTAVDASMNRDGWCSLTFARSWADQLIPLAGPDAPAAQRRPKRARRRSLRGAAVRGEPAGFHPSRTNGHACLRTSLV